MHDMSDNRFHVEDPILLIDFVNFVLILISIDYFIKLIIVKNHVYYHATMPSH